MLSPFRLALSLFEGSGSSGGATKEQFAGRREVDIVQSSQTSGLAKRRKKSRIPHLNVAKAASLSLVALASMSPKSAAAPTGADKGIWMEADRIDMEAQATQAVSNSTSDSNSPVSLSFPIPIASTTTSPVMTTTAVPTIVSASATCPPATATSIPAATGFTVPRPFDNTIWTNFTEPSCPTFFESFVNDHTFITCAPFSLMLRVRPIRPPYPANTMLTLRSTRTPTSKPPKPPPSSPQPSTPPAPRPSPPAAR